MAPQQRPHRSKQDYATPPEFIAAVKRRLGITEFAIDLAASAANTQARLFYSEQEDALEQHWGWKTGQWGWLNPPFKNIGPWAAKCHEFGWFANPIAFLVPASVGSNWFRDHVDGYAKVLFLNGRLAFMPDKPKWLYPKDCMLCLYGQEPGYEVWDWKRELQ